MVQVSHPECLGWLSILAALSAQRGAVGWAVGFLEGLPPLPLSWEPQPFQLHVTGSSSPFPCSGSRATGLDFWQELDLNDLALRSLLGGTQKCHLG